MQHGVTAMPMYSGAWCVYSAFFFVTSRQVQARHPEATWTGKFQQAGGVIVSEQLMFSSSDFHFLPSKVLLARSKQCHCDAVYQLLLVSFTFDGPLGLVKAKKIHF